MGTSTLALGPWFFMPCVPGYILVFARLRIMCCGGRKLMVDEGEL
jgi:hypothetical protein